MTNSDAIIAVVDREVQAKSELFTHAARKALIIKTVLNATKVVATSHGLSLADIDDIDGFLNMPYVPLETKEVEG